MMEHVTKDSSSPGTRNRNRRGGQFHGKKPFEPLRGAGSSAWDLTSGFVNISAMMMP
jgi:hypothetical protein